MHRSNTGLNWLCFKNYTWAHWSIHHAAFSMGELNACVIQKFLYSMLLYPLSKQNGSLYLTCGCWVQLVRPGGARPLEGILPPLEIF